VISELATPVAWKHLGRISYDDATRLQDDTWSRVVSGDAAECIFTLEHDPVITIGRRGEQGDVLLPEQALAERGVTVVRADRGGEVTYHGPGQLVIYPILNIKKRGIAVGDLVRGVAGSVNQVLAALEINATYDGQNPGLWCDGKKICAVGMRIKKGVSRHGAAVNLSTDLSAFELIVPCGLPDSQTTSVSKLNGEAPSVASFAADVVRVLRETFSLGAPPS
jgi:lipoyl(octanoyl) transferase